MADSLLVVFDFDHTIVDENSSVIFRKLLPTEEVPDAVKILRHSDSWMAYMTKMFELLHANAIDATQITRAIFNIPAVPGMETLLTKLHSHKCEIIIISDSNSIFLDQWLKHKKLDHTIAQIFTNPAMYDSVGLLRINEYHVQDWCELSAKNLCKGHILETYIDRRAKEGTRFDAVAYIGDGKNDFCPILRLSENDLAFPRIGYKLQKVLEKDSNENHRVKAKVIPWNDGADILQELMKKINLNDTVRN